MNIIALKSNRQERYSIFEFINMTDSQRDLYKDSIVCIECNGKAYYRGPSKDGKNACFGAKHLGDCYKSSSNLSNNDEGTEEVNEIELLTSRFDIRWNYNKSNEGNEGNEVNRGETSGEISGENRKKYIKKPQIEKNAKISLNQILELAESNIIEHQDYLIKLYDNPVLLSDIVMNLEYIDDSYLDREMFYWGKISSFNGNWLNTSYINKLSIIIDKYISEKFWKVYEERFLKVIKNNSIIIFGKPKRAKSGNLYIQLKNIKHFYIKRATRP